MSRTDDFEKRRVELYKANSRAWAGEDVFKTGASLDTSLKKNTAFIKRIRAGITKESEKQFIDGIRSTSLEKYLNEISSALCESLGKVSKNVDLQSAVEVVSSLHQRFTTKFTPFIELYFVNSFVHPTEKLVKKEEKDQATKTRNLLKLTMELYLTGVFRNLDDMPDSELPLFLMKLKNAKKGDIPVIIPVLKQVMSYEPDSGITLSVMTSFLKRFGSIIFEDNPRHEENYMIFIRRLFKSYTENAVSFTEKYYKNIIKMKATAKVIAIKTGKIVENMENTADELDLIFQEFKGYCEYACPMVGVELPKLEAEMEKGETSKVTLVQQTQKSNQLWDNEDMRRFYEDIPNLESIVSKEAIESVNSKIQVSDVKGAKIVDIISRLDIAETAKDVDDIVVDFWEWGLSNRASRNRLSKHIVELKDVSKFKNIARFLKINQKYFEKCIEDLITRLDKSFRFQIHHDTITEKDIIIFSELIKFKMVPIHVIFHKIRTLILNIEVNGNIDLLSLMFEGCSKILLYDDEYKDYTRELIQLLVQLYKTKKFSHSDKLAVRVFLLSLKPQRPRAQKKMELLKEERFLLYLIKTQLNKKTYKIVSNTIKCADWNNLTIYNRIEKIFSNAADVSYMNIKYLASIFKDLTLNSNHSLRTVVVDQVIEDITVGLENNDYQSSRTRIAQCIYFTEFVNQNIISKDLLVPMLYKIVCFGHSNNYPNKNTYAELDPPDDHFRIRLVSLMLNRLQPDILKKNQISLIITFIKFFNYYIFTKDQPLSVDLDSNLNEAYEHLRKYWKVDNVTKPKSYSEAVAELQSALSTKPTESNEEKDKEALDEDDNDASEASDGSEASSESDEEDDESDGEVDMNEAIGLKPVVQDNNYDESESDDGGSGEDESGDDSEDNSENDDSDESDIEEGKHEVVLDDDNDDGMDDPDQAFHEAKLDIEFKKILDESLQGNNSSSLNKGLLSDRIGTPESILYKLKNSEDSSPENNDKSVGRIKFTLLNRAGKKVQPKNILVPESSKIAMNVTKEQERLRAERDKIKNYVLNNA